MNRKITYIIDRTHLPATIRSYLLSKGYSAQNLIRLKKDVSSILVNHVPQFMNYPLQEKDVLTVNIREENSSDKIVPVNLPLDIVYEDEDIMVINKPPGMPIHPSFNNYENSLANGLAWYFMQQHTPFVFRCVNRLDRDTSGLTIIAKHMVSAGILSSMITRREIYREYLAIVQGIVVPHEGIIDAPIARKEGSILERTVAADGERAITHYHTLKQEQDLTLLSLRLETGRTHQIRVHMKYLGYPLIGDYLYNPDTSRIARQALHSYRLSFTHPITGAHMEFTAKLPLDMQLFSSNDP